MTGAVARAILEEIEAQWWPLRDAAEALGLSRWEEKTPSGWSAKEMLAHVAFWEEAPIGYVTLALRGQELPGGWRFGSGYYPEGAWPGADEHNAREAAWARDQTPEAVLARWDAAHEKLVEFLASVTDEEAQGYPAYFSGEIPGHFANHLPELQALLDKGTTGGQ